MKKPRVIGGPEPPVDGDKPKEPETQEGDKLKGPEQQKDDKGSTKN